MIRDMIVVKKSKYAVGEVESVEVNRYDAVSFEVMKENEYGTHVLILLDAAGAVVAAHNTWTSVYQEGALLET